MSKKGIAILTKVLIGIIISIPILIILGYVGTSLFGLIAPQDDSKDFFNEFVEATEIATLSEASRELVYFVGKDNLLIGFPKNINAVEGINRPIAEDKCGEKDTCFCLCKNVNDEDSCLRTTSICAKSDIYESINGIVIDEDKTEKEDLDGLLIKGRTKLPITIRKEDNALIARTISDE